MKKLRLGILVSGNGTNLQAILNACAQKRIDAEVAVVISNQPSAYALERAKKAHVPALCLDHETKMIEALQACQVDLVCLAGFMKILSGPFLKAFPNRIINIHPALLPSFPGLNAQRRALEHGVKISGATVHFVDEGTDTGPIIVQSAVPVYDDDSEETLRARILAEEHKIYPQAIQLLATQSLKIAGRQVIKGVVENKAIGMPKKFRA